MKFLDLETVKLSERLSPFADKVYKERFGARKIKRMKRKDGKVHILDGKFSIDVILTLNGGVIITGQEKFRSFEAYERYGGEATIEFYQNPKKKEKGEFFHLASQFYLWGFSNFEETGFLRYFCLDVLKLMLAISSDRISYRVYENHIHSKASFIAFRLEDVPADCILFEGGKRG